MDVTIETMELIKVILILAIGVAAGYVLSKWRSR